MRIVFMGTPAFAATCLKAVLETGHSVVGVYTKVDTPKNRGMKLIPSEVKALALQYGLPVFQPKTFKDDAVYEELKALAPDLIVVVAYGKILPRRVLDIPPLGCINIHGSILPALRGSAPVQWAVLNDLPETGVTAMYLNAAMDEGDIIDSASTAIGPLETAGELMDRLAVLGAELLKKTLKQIEEGTAPRTAQDPALATYAPMLTKEMAPIDWNRSARQVLAQIRGLNPWPTASAELGGVSFKIYQAQFWQTEKKAEPGTPLELTKQGLAVSCRDGAVLITRLQAAGGKVMAAPDYFRGHPIRIETV